MWYCIYHIRYTIDLTYCALGSSYVKGFYIYQICVVDMNVSADII